MVHEDVKGVDVRMFALYDDVFSELFKGFEIGMLDEVYDNLKIRYKERKRVALDYFYIFLQKNEDHFLNKNKSLKETDLKRDALFQYWDNKGMDAKPIYHYLGLNNNKGNFDRTILNYKIEYYGGISKIFNKVESLLLTGKPVIIEVGGYEIEYLLTDISFESKYSDKQGESLYYSLYYTINGIINGDTSSVTLITTGEDYNLGELYTAHSNSNYIGMEEHDVEEVMYEIGDVIKSYYNDITETYSVYNDSIDWDIVKGTDFNGKNISKTKGDF